MGGRGGRGGGGGLTERSLVPCPHILLCLLPGGTRWRLRRRDRQEITSVMSAKAKVCREQMFGKP